MKNEIYDDICLVTYASPKIVDCFQVVLCLGGPARRLVGCQTDDEEEASGTLQRTIRNSFRRDMLQTYLALEDDSLISPSSVF